jgi:putative transcriptional regulator
MPIIIKLDVMLADRKVKSKDLAEHVGITEANMSLLKQGKVKGMRFDTLERICEYLHCQPGDILKFTPESGQLDKA